MKKVKKYIRYSIGGLVALVLGVAIVLTFTAAKQDIPDDQVEQMAMDLNLVSMDEAEYPSVPEMEERIQSYKSGEAFTNVSVRLSIFLVLAIVVITIGLSMYKLVQNKQKLVRFLIPAGGLILVFIISRIAASSSKDGINTTVPVSETDLTNVSTLINATLILLVISFTALGTYRIKHILTK